MQMQSLQYIYISLINMLRCCNELYESTGAKTRMICHLLGLFSNPDFSLPCSNRAAGLIVLSYDGTFVLLERKNISID